MSVSPINARPGARDLTAAALGLNMRERAAVRAAHTVDVAAPQMIDGRYRWNVACSCGWGTTVNGGAGDACDLHGEHLAGWLIEAARIKRAESAVEDALRDGHALTRERFSHADADAALTSIAPLPAPWYIARPGATAHVVVDGETLCGAFTGATRTPQRARAYNRRCVTCSTAVGA